MAAEVAAMLSGEGSRAVGPIERGSLAAIAALLVSGIGAAACYRGLYADGAFHFVLLITRDDIVRLWPSRLFADYLMDYPAVMALDLGVRSLRALASIFTASLLYVPILAYSAAIWIARIDPLLWVATMAVVALCYYPTSFFLVGEFHLLYALFWLGFIILLSGIGDRPGGALGLVLVAALLIRSYDISVVLCPWLALLCAWRIVATADRRARLLLAVAIGLLLVAAWTGLQGALTPTDPSSEANFVRQLHNNGLYGRLGLVALALAAAFAPQRWLTAALCGLLAVLLISTGIVAGRHPERLILGPPYNLRAAAFLLLMGIGAIVLALRRVGWPRPGVRFAVGPVLLLFFAVAGATLYDTAGWAQHLTFLCDELRSGGRVDPVRFLAQPLVRKYRWGWTGPTMSILLRPEGSTRILVFHDPGKASFEPFNPVTEAPDISIFKAAGPICRTP